MNKLETDLVHGHYYCNIAQNGNRKVFNSNQYDYIDRSDENNERVLSKNIQNLNVSNLEFCENTGHQSYKIITLEEHNNLVNISKGIVCQNSCLETTNWCWKKEYCIQNGTIFLADDIELCRDHNFWKDVSCTQYDYGSNLDGQTIYTFIHFGLRCNGSTQMCIYPWYLDLRDPDLDPYGRKMQCLDKSDQVFEMKTCPDINHYVQVKRSIFCNGTKLHSRYDHYEGGKNNLKCDNPVQYIAEYGSPSSEELCLYACLTNKYCLQSTCREEFCWNQPIITMSMYDPVENVTIYESVTKTISRSCLLCIKERLKLMNDPHNCWAPVTNQAPTVLHAPIMTTFPAPNLENVSTRIYAAMAIHSVNMARMKTWPLATRSTSRETSSNPMLLTAAPVQCMKIWRSTPPPVME